MLVGLVIQPRSGDDKDISDFVIGAGDVGGVCDVGDLVHSSFKVPVGALLSR